MSLLDNIMERQSARLEVGKNKVGKLGAIVGTATSDSADGMVDVALAGTVVGADTLTGTGTTSVPLPCIWACRAGDDVLVLLYGNGLTSSPCVLGPIGADDRSLEEIGELGGV